MHSPTEFTDIFFDYALFLKLETNAGFLFDFVVDEGLRSERRNIFDCHVEYSLVVLFAELGEFDVQSNEGLTHIIILVTADSRSEFFLLQKSEQRVLPFVSEDMRDIVTDVHLILGSQIVDNPEELQVAFILNRLNPHKFSKLFWREWEIILASGIILVWNLLHMLEQLLLHLFYGKRGAYRYIHDVRTVVFVVKFNQICTNFAIPECFVVSDPESAEWWGSQFADDLPFPAIIIVGPKNVLFMDCLTLLANATFSQQRSCEEIA